MPTHLGKKTVNMTWNNKALTSFIWSSPAGWWSRGGGGADEEDGGAAAAAGGGVYTGGDGYSLWKGEERKHTYRYRSDCLPLRHSQSPVDSPLPLCCWFSGGEGPSTWPGVASCGGTRIQIWGLCSQRRAVTTHHASTGSLEHFFKAYFSFFKIYVKLIIVSNTPWFCVPCVVDGNVVNVCVSCVGLFMGRPWILSAQQAPARHGPAIGWKIPGTITKGWCVGDMKGLSVEVRVTLLHLAETKNGRRYCWPPCLFIHLK